MSFFDDASLVFLPSGEAGKDGKAYSMKPTDGSGDFTFSRGSNLTATRVDSNGLIEKGRENLLLQSNQFDTTWTNNNSTETSGQSGYDGSSDAWLLTSLSSYASIQQNINVSGVFTISLYLKSGSNGGVLLQVIGISNSLVRFNLDNGTLISKESAVISANIESIGNGWHRASYTLNGSITTFRIYPADNTGDHSVVGSIYIQDAQLEQGLVATEYIESGASKGLAGILEDSPRFDFSGGASCPSLLLEPSRTNLITQSEYLEGYNQISNLTLDLTNETLSPEGLNNSYSLTATSTSALIRERINPLASGTYTFSFYAKYDSSQFIAVRNSYLAASFESYVWFDVQNKTKGTTSGSSVVDYDIEDVGNGWVRCYVTTTSTSSGDSYFFIYFADSNGGFSTTIGNKLYLYGWQCEQGSYSSSYIPNHSGGSVTRAADVCEGAGTSSTFNDDEGVLYAEIASNNDGQYKFIALTDGTSANKISIFLGNTDSKFSAESSGSGVNLGIYDKNIVTKDFNKIALKYKRNDCSLWLNGQEIGTDTTFASFSSGTLTQLEFHRGDNNFNFYGNVKQVLYFPTALSDAECITLTS